MAYEFFDAQIINIIDENDVVNVAKTPTLSQRKTLKKLSTK